MGNRDGASSGAVFGGVHSIGTGGEMDTSGGVLSNSGVALRSGAVHSFTGGAIEKEKGVKRCARRRADPGEWRGLRRGDGNVRADGAAREHRSMVVYRARRDNDTSALHLLILQ